MSAASMLRAIETCQTVVRAGRVRKVLPTFVEADGPSLPLGALCEIETMSGSTPIAAEVVGVRSDAIVLAPFSESARIGFGARVTGLTVERGGPVGDALLGRAVDALGRPIDGAPLSSLQSAPIGREGANPLGRVTPKRVLHTGIRAIDGFLTLGQGQRVGVFAPSGAGKTTLLTQLANQVAADRCVICLVGERGREVEALWAESLEGPTKKRSVLVAATSDQSAALRVRAGWYALAIADHWRREGHHVLLVLDSVTRLAMAMREIGLAAGEPPTMRAYTPSVFSALPRLVEGCGALRDGGSISAIMTVLSETEDVDDPICEVMKSLLDGHIILSRQLASEGHFPAIDVPVSISRLARDLVDGRHRSLAQNGASVLSTYEQSRVLIESGVYAKGANADLDRIIGLRPRLMSFLEQGVDEKSDFATTVAGLEKALTEMSL